MRRKSRKGRGCCLGIRKEGKGGGRRENPRRMRSGRKKEAGKATKHVHLSHSTGSVRQPDWARGMVARAVLVDMEPKVINQTLSFASRTGNWRYGPQSAFCQKQGSGNNWAHGYCVHGSKHEDVIMNLIRKEAEKCDRLGGFLMIMSMAGGTGSGLGAFVTAALREAYPNSFLLNHVIWPYGTGENDAVHKICLQLMKIKQVSFQDVNRAIAHQDLMEALVPHPEFKMLGLRNIPQMSENSLAFTTFAWPGLLKHLRRCSSPTPNGRRERRLRMSILAIQLGQCGNQIGREVFDTICTDLHSSQGFCSRKENDAYQAASMVARCSGRHGTESDQPDFILPQELGIEIRPSVCLLSETRIRKQLGTWVLRPRPETQDVIMNLIRRKQRSVTARWLLDDHEHGWWDGVGPGGICDGSPKRGLSKLLPAQPRYLAVWNRRGDLMEALVPHPEFKMLGLRNIPQMSENSLAFTTFAWPGLLKHLRQMLIANAKMEEETLRIWNTPRAFNKYEKSASLVSNSQFLLSPLNSLVGKAWKMFASKTLCLFAEDQDSDEVNLPCTRLNEEHEFCSALQMPELPYLWSLSYKLHIFDGGRTLNDKGDSWLQLWITPDIS
ncbi:hypothetical protein E2320_018152, partial [Naja naja]